MSARPVSSFYRNNAAQKTFSANQIACVSKFTPYMPRTDSERVFRRCRIFNGNNVEVGFIVQDGIRNFGVKFYDPISLRDDRKQAMCFGSPGEVRNFIQSQISGARINGWLVT